MFTMSYLTASGHTLRFHRLYSQSEIDKIKTGYLYNHCVGILYFEKVSA